MSEELERRRRRLSIISSGLLFAAVATTVTAFVATLSSGLNGDRIFERPTDVAQDEKIANLQSRISTLQSDVYSEGEPVSPMDSGRVVAIEQRQKALDEALSQNTDRVLALATMRKDIDDLSEDNARQIESLERQISELRTILLGLAGSLITILLAFVGWLGLRKKSDEG